MGFRNPITSLSASQITAGTLAGDVIGSSLRTATTGRRVVISTSAGDAGRIDFYGDPQSGAGEGHADIRATAYGGVSSRAYLNLEADQGATLVVGSADNPAGGVYTTVQITADYLQVLGAVVGTPSVIDPTNGLLRRIINLTEVVTVPAIGAGGGWINFPISHPGPYRYWYHAINGDAYTYQPAMLAYSVNYVSPTLLQVRVANTVAGPARINVLCVYDG